MRNILQVGSIYCLILPLLNEGEGGSDETVVSPSLKAASEWVRIFLRFSLEALVFFALSFLLLFPLVIVMVGADVRASLVEDSAEICQHVQHVQIVNKSSSDEENVKPDYSIIKHE